MIEITFPDGASRSYEINSTPFDIKMVMDSIKVNKNEAIELLNKHKSVRSAIKNYIK